jgi:DASS family divalent anion:Na+ symporter
MIKKLFSLMIAGSLACSLFFLPISGALPVGALRLLAIFIFTIGLIMMKLFPMGQCALIGITISVVSRTLTFQEAFSGFTNSTVWLIALAFFIAKGFVKTGLGLRIAYLLMEKLGKNTLGLGYGIALTDLIIAPVIPSMTARSGGVIYPVVMALSKVFKSEPHSHPRAMGAYLVQTAFQTTCVTGAMFLTAMAGNPLIAEIAKNFQVDLTWWLWFKAAFVPGLGVLLAIPYLLYRFYPPDIKHTHQAQAIASKALKEMGPLKKEEGVLIGVFMGLITLWILGPSISMDATQAALLGLVALLAFKVLSWDEVISEKAAWDTLVWFSTLVMMAGFLNQRGVIGVMSGKILEQLNHLPAIGAFVVAVLFYFYTHYFFASNVAHIGAMFPAFLAVLIGLGINPVVSVLALAMVSNLFGCLTHYGSGPAPILYGAGYVKVQTWWKIGLAMSIFYLTLFFILGGVYWKIIGLY